MKALDFTSRAATRWRDDDLEPIARAHDLRDGFAVLSWVLIVVSFLVGAVARLVTIDRGTPGIGVMIHCVMMGAVFVLVALPTGVVAGMASALFKRRWPVVGTWTPLFAALAAAAVVWVFMHLGRCSPAWHVVWPTMLWAALLACKVLPVGVRTIEALRVEGKS